MQNKKYKIGSKDSSLQITTPGSTRHTHTFTHYLNIRERIIAKKRTSEQKSIPGHSILGQMKRHISTTRNNPVCERLKSFRKYSDAVSGCEGQKQEQLEKTKS